MNTIDITWDLLDDKSTLGYTYEGEEIIISALQNRAQAAKWNEPYRSGRSWTAYNTSSIIVASGHAANLREAKKEATAAIVASRAPKATLLKNHQHEDLGPVILNTETNKFVTGSIGGTIVEFIQFEGGQLIYRSGYDSHEAWMIDVEKIHTEIVAELEADGFGVDL